jgi:hypothetical protein
MTPHNIPEERRSYQHRCGSLKSRFLTSFIMNQNDALQVVGYGQAVCHHVLKVEQFLLLTLLVESHSTWLHLTHQMSLSFGFMISYLQLHSLKSVSARLNSSKLWLHVVDSGFCAVLSLTCVSWVLKINNKTLPHFLKLCKFYWYLCFFRTVWVTWSTQIWLFL